MTDTPSTQPIKKSRPWRKWLKRLAVILLAPLIFVIAFVLLLPSIISTNYANRLIVQQGSAALKRPMSMQSLRWSWSDGIEVLDAQIKDDPAFSDKPIFSIHRLTVDFSVLAFINKVAAFTVKLDGFHASMIRSQEGKLNLDAFLSAFPPKKKPPEKEQPLDLRRMSLQVLFDVQCQVELKNLNLDYEDRQRRQHSRIENASIMLQAPSLYRSPVTLTVATDLDLNGSRIQSPRVAIMVKNAFQSDGALSLTNGSIGADADLPGLDLKINGQLNSINATLAVDLKKLGDTAKPFLAPPLSDTELNGLIDFTLTVTGDPNQALKFNGALSAEDVSMQGGLLKDKRVEPLDFKLLQKGEVVLKDGKPVGGVFEASASLPGAELTVKGDLNKLVGKLALDLEPLLTVAKPFLTPPASDSNVSGSVVLDLDASGDLNQTLNATVSIVGEKIRLAGQLIQGKTLENVNFKIVNQASVDQTNQRLIVKKGEIYLFDSVQLLWNADVSRFKESSPAIVFNGKLTLALAKFLADVKPFLTPPILTSTIDGAVTVELSAQGEVQKNMNLQATLAGDNISLAGDIVRGKTLGPVKFKILNEGGVNLAEQKAVVKKGEILLLDSSQILWSAEVAQFKQQTPLLTFNLGPVFLNLKELYEVAQGFVPENLSFDFIQKDSKNPPSLKLESLRFSNRPENQTNPIAIKNLSVQAPALNITVGDAKMFTEGAFFSILDFDAVLKAFYPEKLNLTWSAGLGQFKLQQPPLFVQGLKLPGVSIAVDNIKPSQTALFGLSATIRHKENLSVESVGIPKFFQVDKLEQGTDFELTLTDKATADLKLNKLSATSPAVTVESPELGKIKTDVHFLNTITLARIDRLAPFSLNVDGFKASLELGNILKSSLEVAAKNLGVDRLDTKGQIELDLGQASSLLPASLFKGVSLSGRIRSEWETAGRRPNENELNQLKNAGASLSTALSNTGFLARLRVSTALQDVAVSMPLANNQAIVASDITTVQPMTLTLAQGLNEVATSLDATVGKIESLPGLGKLKRPLALSFAFSGKQQGLKSLSVNQRLSLPQLNVSQSFDLNLFGVNRLLNKGLDTNPTLWLKLLGGTVVASLDIGDKADLSLFTDQLTLNGPVGVDVEALLDPDKSITLKTKLESDGLDLKLGDSIQFKQMQAHLNLRKRYEIEYRQDESPQNAKTPHLSQSALKLPESDDARGVGFSQNFIDDLKRQFTGSRHTLSFDSAHFNVKPIPLTLHRQTMDFRLEKGLPVMDYFQMDMLGGTAIASFSVFPEGKGYVARAKGAFSGINMKKLFPQAARDVSDKEAEIGGQFSLLLPLSAELDSTLQGINLNLELTQIGSQALERILFALDPYESNESLVKQRKTLKSNTVKWIRAEIKYGNLSVKGAVDVQGVSLDLPPISQMNIANLPGLESLQAATGSLAPILTLLENISADTLAIDDSGAVRFVK